MAGVTRRFAFGALLAAVPLAAAARNRSGYLGGPGGGVLVDVSPLRRYGDNTDADFLEAALPGYLAQAFGPGHSIRVRIDSVVYGVAGSNGLAHNNGAVDTIEGVGWVDGREVPLMTSIQTTVSFPDVGGYAARVRQELLARSFAQWLPSRAGNWR